MLTAPLLSLSTGIPRVIDNSETLLCPVVHIVLVDELEDFLIGDLSAPLHPDGHPAWGQVLCFLVLLGAGEVTVTDMVNEVLEKGRNLFTIAMRGGQPHPQDSAIGRWNHWVGCSASVGCAEGDDKVDALPTCEGGPVILDGVIISIDYRYVLPHFVVQKYCVGGGGFVG